MNSFVKQYFIIMKIDKTKIKSSKGDLSAVIFYPDEKTDKLAILCAGFLDSKDYKGLVGLAKLLCKRGYVVVRFDATGIWESEGDISDYDTTQYLQDIGNVLEYMLAKEDYKNILLGGHSRGGMVSILYAAKDKRISAVLGVMPSPKNIMSEEDRSKWKNDGFNILTRDLPENRNKNIEFKVPYSHVEDRDKYDSAESVKNVHVPIVFIAGELDDIVEPEEVEDIYNNANEPKSFVIIPGIDHDYRLNDAEVEKVNAEIAEQLDLIGI